MTIAIPKDTVVKGGCAGFLLYCYANSQIAAGLRHSPKQNVITSAQKQGCQLAMSSAVVKSGSKQGCRLAMSSAVVKFGSKQGCRLAMSSAVSKSGSKQGFWCTVISACCVTMLLAVGLGAGPRVQRPPACVLCPVVGPPLRRTSCGRFCHVGCAQWLEETFTQHGLVHGLRNVSKVPSFHLRIHFDCYVPCPIHPCGCMQCN